MQYLTKIDEIHLKQTAVTMGKFDGVHLGHQKLIEKLKAAKKSGLTTVVFTFYTPPSKVLYQKGQQLMTAAEKRFLYEQSGIDVLIDYPADSSFFAQSPEDFVASILVSKLDVRYFVAGPDFRFGAKRAGDINCLKHLGDQHGFFVDVLEKETYKEKEISSTRIKEEMEQGNLSMVEAMLGHPYFIMVTGGKEEWLETLPEEKLLPGKGIYKAELKGCGQNDFRCIPCDCEVINSNQIKISLTEKNCWTESEECVILFRNA